MLADQNSEILRDQVKSLDSTQINLEAEAEKVAENMRPRSGFIQFLVEQNLLEEIFFYFIKKYDLNLRKSIYETHPDGPHLEPRATSQMTSSPLGSPIMLNATPNGIKDVFG